MAAVSGATVARADVVIPGTGFSAFGSGVVGQGNSGQDAFGNTWAWSGGAWSTSISTYGSNVPANDFEIIFLFAPQYAGKISGGSMIDYSDNMTWTSVIKAGGNEIAFYAPSHTALSKGESYKIAVQFSEGGLSGATAGFTASFTTTSAVPEASTWSMMSLGLTGLGFAAYRSGRTKSPRAIA